MHPNAVDRLLEEATRKPLLSRLGRVCRKGRKPGLDYDITLMHPEEPMADAIRRCVQSNEWARLHIERGGSGVPTVFWVEEVV